MRPAPDRKMRALHVMSGDRWAGAEVQAYTLLSSLKDKLELHAVVLNEGELALRLRERCIPVTVIDENRFSTWKLFTGIQAVVKSFEPDIIHTHRQKENILASFANFVTRRRPCIRTQHGAPEFAPQGRQKMQVWLDHFCARRLQRYTIAVSDALGDQLKAMFGNERIRVILNGVDPLSLQQQTTPASLNQRPDHVFNIGVVGRIEPVKRVDIFLNIAKILTGRPGGEKRWHFHVIGDGSQLEAMRSLCGELELNGQVTFHGHRSDVNCYIAALDAVVMPSDHEGLPMVALECLALNVPIVAHAVGGLTALLEGVDRRLLVASQEPEQYAKALEDIVGEDIEIQLPEAYLSRTNAAATLDLYNHLINTNP